MPALDTLAAAVGMSRFHFHRVFKAVTGLTPRAYATAHRYEPRPQRADAKRDGHGCHLRRRLQFQRAFLRDLIEGARHDADHVPRRRRGRCDPLRCW